jgi:hypothetical protein
MQAVAARERHERNALHREKGVADGWRRVERYATSGVPTLDVAYLLAIYLQAVALPVFPLPQELLTFPTPARHIHVRPFPRPFQKER